MNVAKRRCLPGVLAYYVALASISAVAGEGNPELAKTLVAGLKTHIEKLRSGSVEFEVLNKDGATSARRFVAFDNPIGKVRSDAEVFSQVFPRGRIVRVARTKKQFLQFVDQKGPAPALLTRLNPGEESPVSEGMPFDIRGVGLCSYRDLTIGGTAEKCLENLCKRERSASAVLERDVGVLLLEIKDLNTQLVYWIDTSRDYVPLRYEVRLVSPNGSSAVRQRIETSWGKVNDTWIPTRGVCRLGIKGDTADVVDEMRFDWKSVNEKIPETLFSEESLKLPKNTYVVDTRLGKPIVERVIGVDRHLPEIPMPQRLSLGRMVALIVCTVLLLVLVAILIFRRRRGLPLGS